MCPTTIGEWDEPSSSRPWPACLLAEHHNKTHDYPATLIILLPSLPFARRISDVLSALMNAHLMTASDAKITEEERRKSLVSALTYNQGAAEALATAAGELASRSGNTRFTAALMEQVRAGAITKKYPAGITTSVTEVGLGSAGAGAGAGAGGAEPDVRVFRTLFENYGGDANAVASASASAAISASGGSSAVAIAAAPSAAPAAITAPLLPKNLLVVCECIDALLVRASEIQADIGISMTEILHEVSGGGAGSSAPGGGITTTGFAPGAALLPATTLTTVKRKAPEAVGAAAAAAIEEPVVGVKRAREGDEEAQPNQA